MKLKVHTAVFVRNLPITMLILATIGCAGKPASQDRVPWYVDDLSDGQAGSGSADDPYRQLQDAIDAAEDGDTIYILEGTHFAVASEAIDPTCGNCDDADFRAEIPITVGFRISDKAIHMKGESRGGTVLNTGAGYGLLFENAGVSSVSNLTVTGGTRDADGRATDAAIVARYTELSLTDLDVVENNDLYRGEPDPVVGVMGITGREGAQLTVTGCRVLDNSWDGITLYRGDPDVPDSAPTATIRQSEIGCTTDCLFNANGRGVGIGVTWDATATIEHSRIHNYWKGIGSFGTTHVVVRNNLVHDTHGWGVIASGESTMQAVNNTIVNNGNVGLAVWNPEAVGMFVNNIVTGNGGQEEWVAKRTGVWMNDGGDSVFAYNDVWGNHGEDVCRDGTPGGGACTPIEFDGIDGNRSVSPEFADETDFRLAASSPLNDAGDPEIMDPDGSPSAMGAYGGPGGDWKGP
jgi:hypothetical protein